MNPLHDSRVRINRRHFFGRASVGSASLASLLNEDLLAEPTNRIAATGGWQAFPGLSPQPSE